MSERTDLWSTRYHPARPYLLLRALYLLLAADLWLGMIEHGARYAMGGFNVAHFALVERLLPLPTPAFYVGLLIASGALSLMLAIGSLPVALRLLLAATYTLSWIVSIHDSYQHHYLISWLLLWLCAYPLPCGDEARRATAHVQGWGVPMTVLTCAIVYAYTGISKSEAEWRSGYVLRSLSNTKPPGAARPGKLDGARDLLMQVGMDEATAWQLMSLGTIALQWMIAIGYLASLRRDERPSRLRHTLVTIGLVGALAFHAMAEFFELFEIGVFSYYMIWIGLVLLSPTRLLTPIAGLFDAIGRSFARAFALSEHSPTMVNVSLAILSAVVLGATGSLIPLPGALPATLSVACLVVLCTLLPGRGDVARTRQTLGLTSLLTALALWAALTKTSVPFDYYRRGAGELQRMGRLEEALEMYRAAERVAPAGESRAERIEELESELRLRGNPPRKSP